MSTELKGLLEDGLQRLGLDIPPSQVDMLLAYLDLLQRWNKTYNLTAIRDPRRMVSHHLLDSLSILPWIGQGSLLDVGTGAGLPGVPVAVVSGVQATLVDSVGKKIRFLRQVKRNLAIENIHPQQTRIENFPPGESLVTITSRAFSALVDFALAVRHLIQPDTRLLAMKGRYPKEELAGLPSWIEVEAVEKLDIPGLHEDRHLIIMRECS